MISKTRTTAIFICVGLANALWGLLFSLQPPFYPAEAENKGATPSQYAFVYGMAHLAAFLFSPIFARYGNKLGPKVLFITGSFLQGIVSILFGLLEFVNETNAFITLSYILRFLCGAADAACMAGVLAILIHLYPNKVASVVAMGETLFGLGFGIGPAVGSLLYSLDGFYLPFVAMGVLILLLTIACLIIVPTSNSMDRKMKSFNEENQPLMGDNEYKRDSLDKPFPLMTVLKAGSVLLPYLDTTFFCCCLGMVEALLAPHLSSAGASETGVALNFMILGVIYMIVTPLVGLVCDKSKWASPLCSIVANVLTSVSLLLMGPAPILSDLLGGPSPTLIYIASAILGFAEGLIVVSTFVRSKVAIVNLGFEDDVRTYIAVSSLFFGAFYLGNTVGPLVGGILVEWLGFQITAFVFAIIFVLPFVLNLLELRRIQHSG